MSHPNAATAGASTAPAVFIVWAAGHLGISLGAEEAVLVAGAISTAALLVGRKGLRGIIGTVWHGSSPPPSKT